MNHIYHQLILEHNRSPRNRGALAGATHAAEVVNPTCGDRVRVAMQVDAEGRVIAVAFEGETCAVATASASLMTDAVRGRELAAMKGLGTEFRRFIEAGELLADEVLHELEPLGSVRGFPGRKRCATLPWEALVEAVQASEEEADV